MEFQYVFLGWKFLSSLICWHSKMSLCNNGKSPYWFSAIPLKTITIFQDMLLEGRYLSRLSTTCPSSFHCTIHLLSEAFRKSILMSHGGRGLTSNQDKQKYTSQPLWSVIALSTDMNVGFTSQLFEIIALNPTSSLTDSGCVDSIY